MGWIGMDCLVCTVWRTTSLYDNWLGLVGHELGGG